jgi:hypothetical protein
MNKYFSRLRAMLLTFAIGLASVFILNDFSKTTEIIKVDLPEVQSSSTIFVVPVERKLTGLAESRSGGGGSGGETCDEARAKLKNKNTKLPNCD